MESVDITNTEKEMLTAIGKHMGLSPLAFDELYYAYRYINAQGVASETDVKEIVGLGIPLNDALAELKSLPVTAIADLLNAGSISNEDVKNAFIAMTSVGGFFSSTSL